MVKALSGSFPHGESHVLAILNKILLLWIHRIELKSEQTVF